MSAVLALLPIGLILVLMLGARWSAARAGTLGALAAVLVAVGAFNFPGGSYPELRLVSALTGTIAESGFTALTILWIIGPALGIYQLQLRTGAADVLREALASFAPDPRLLALLVAWFFVLFMEGAAGFGASVALAAPFLVAAGFRPVEAVTVTLIGHAVGVSFGAIGTPVVPQVAATGIPALEIARATGIYHSVLGWVPLVIMIAWVQRALPDHHKGGWAIWVWTAVAFACFVVPYSILWLYVGPELPTVGGALFGGLIFGILVRVFAVRSSQPDPGEGHPPGRVVRAAAPYLVLVAVVLVTRLIPPVRESLQQFVVGWELYGVFSSSMQVLYHPGTVLLLGFIIGAALQRASLMSILEAFLAATRTLVPVVVALMAMLLLSRTMVHSGMTSVLAAAAAGAAGSAWPAFAPFVGMLGTFVTGSATASNILFTDFQRETALVLNLPVAQVVGVQGFGAAGGNMICPHNVVAAGATVGLQGREGEILRRTLWVTLLYTALGGVLALWLLS